MPKLTGKLKTITEYPSAVREVLLRAPRTRTAGKAVIVDEPVRITVDEHGEFTADIAPGAAVLVLVGADFMARESIPLLVAEGMTTIAEAMEAARDFTPDVHDRLAELAAETQKNLEEARGVKAEADSATARMREAAQALKDSVDGSIAEATAGIKKSGSELLASMQALQSKAASSESEAKESAQGAEASRSAALASASAASSSAGEAAESLAGLRAKIEEWKPHGEQLAQWQPQFEWLKENAASGFTKIAELMQDAAAGVRGELSGLVEQAKTAQATAGRHSLKAQAAAKDAESVATRVVDAAIAKQLKSRLDSLNISSVKGLSEALGSKASASHTHATKEITGLDDALKAKADLSVVDEKIRAIPKPVSTWGELEGKPTKFPPEAHAHGIGDVNGLLEQLRGKASESDVSALRARMANLSFAVVDSLPSYPNPNTVYFVR